MYRTIAVFTATCTALASATQVGDLQRPPVLPGRLQLADRLGTGAGPTAGAPRDGSLVAPAGVRVTESDGTTTDSTAAWGWYAMANTSWSTAKTSYALWGGANYASYQWGGAPLYIQDYACQGGYILQKTLVHGRPVDFNIALWQLLQLPSLVDGRPWEAQNAEWHVAHQGAWEGAGELLIMFRHYAAHTGDAASFSTAPERLVCSSPDGGATWTLAGVPQPGLTDSVCSAPPSSLPAVPQPSSPAAPSSSAYLFYDTPSAPFDDVSPSGGNPIVHNSGRLITQTLQLTQATSMLAIPLTGKSSRQLWAANISVIHASSGSVVGTAAIASGSGLGSAWTRIPITAPGGGAGPAPAGLYLMVLTAEDTTPGDKQSDSWFLGVNWITNARPAVSGGAAQVSYGNSTQWLRNPTADPTNPALTPAFVLTVQDAVALELRRVTALAAGGATAGFGLSFADRAAHALAAILAHSSQVPLSAPAPANAVGRYDVHVIPDPYYRGSLEDEPNSGCSYYDVIRMGFASSYIGLRMLEGIKAYSELQAAGLIPSTCSNGSNGSFVGVDNAYAAATAPVPCYSAAEVSAIIATVQAAIGSRFSDPATGRMVAWYGCSCFGAPDGSVAGCGLQDVVNGSVPSGNTCLNAATLDFLPSIFLAAKLGVPAGGVNVSATAAWAEYARGAGQQGYGPGWWHTALNGLEDAGGARTWIANVRWDLVDSQDYAVRSYNNTGDWHFFSPQSIAAGNSTGYGNFPTNAENGGRFFTTAAMVYEAHSAPGSALAGPYPTMYQDWKRMVNDLTVIGQQLAVNDTSKPLLPADRSYLSVPVEDNLVSYLCVKVRNQFNMPNVTDWWNEVLCDYYQDIGFGTPENGVALWSFVAGLLAVDVSPGAGLHLLGQSTTITPGMAPWRVQVAVPTGWPPEVSSVAVSSVAVGGMWADVQCSVAGSSLSCTVSLSPQLN